MKTSTRWTIAVLVIAAALVVALVLELRDDATPGAGGGLGGPAPAREHRDADTPEALAGPRAQAQLEPCPPATDAPGPAALRGITVTCAGDGSPVDVAPALADRPVVLNLWAYWCGPCVDELPAMAEYQQRLGSDALVLTVHQDENATAALLMLAELGVHLPTLQDGRRLIAAALAVPNVMPATVVLRPDGSVAEILPRSFATVEEIEAAVDPLIGRETGVPG